MSLRDFFVSKVPIDLILWYLSKNNIDLLAHYRFVKRLSQVTVEGVQAAAKKYLPAFEDPDKTHTAVVCSPGQFESVRALLHDRYNFNLTEVDDLENSILTQ